MLKTASWLTDVDLTVDIIHLVGSRCTLLTYPCSQLLLAIQFALNFYLFGYFEYLYSYVFTCAFLCMFLLAVQLIALQGQNKIEVEVVAFQGRSTGGPLGQQTKPRFWCTLIYREWEKCAVIHTIQLIFCLPSGQPAMPHHYVWKCW